LRNGELLRIRAKKKKMFPTKIKNRVIREDQSFRHGGVSCWRSFVGMCATCHGFQGGTRELYASCDTKLVKRRCNWSSSELINFGGPSSSDSRRGHRRRRRRPAPVVRACHARCPPTRYRFIFVLSCTSSPKDLHCRYRSTPFMNESKSALIAVQAARYRSAVSDPSHLGPGDDKKVAPFLVHPLLRKEKNT